MKNDWSDWTMDGVAGEWMESGSKMIGVVGQWLEWLVSGWRVRI